ncbi:MAG: hypothetical protein ABIA04_02185 [Pseudomonadota bacterium]
MKKIIFLLLMLSVLSFGKDKSVHTMLEMPELSEACKMQGADAKVFFFTPKGKYIRHKSWSQILNSFEGKDPLMANVWNACKMEVLEYAAVHSLNWHYDRDDECSAGLWSVEKRPINTETLECKYGLVEGTKKTDFDYVKSALKDRLPLASNEMYAQVLSKFCSSEYYEHCTFVEGGIEYLEKVLYDRVEALKYSLKNDLPEDCDLSKPLTGECKLIASNLVEPEENLSLIDTANELIDSAAEVLNDEAPIEKPTIEDPAPEFQEDTDTNQEPLIIQEQEPQVAAEPEVFLQTDNELEKSIVDNFKAQIKETIGASSFKQSEVLALNIAAIRCFGSAKTTAAGDPLKQQMLIDYCIDALSNLVNKYADIVEQNSYLESEKYNSLLTNYFILYRESELNNKFYDEEYVYMIAKGVKFASHYADLYKKFVQTDPMVILRFFYLVQDGNPQRIEQAADKFYFQVFSSQKNHIEKAFAFSELYKRFYIELEGNTLIQIKMSELKTILDILDRVEFRTHWNKGFRTVLAFSKTDDPGLPSKITINKDGEGIILLRQQARQDLEYYFPRALKKFLKKTGY